nr:hypothetical protein Iba_chr05cCG16980 [Ipomoea batatas]
MTKRTNTKKDYEKTKRKKTNASEGDTWESRRDDLWAVGLQKPIPPNRVAASFTDSNGTEVSISALQTFEFGSIFAPESSPPSSFAPLFCGSITNKPQTVARKEDNNWKHRSSEVEV